MTSSISLISGLISIAVHHEMKLIDAIESDATSLSVGEVSENELDDHPMFGLRIMHVLGKLADRIS